MKPKRKIVDASLVRGRAAETRLLSRLHPLKGRVPWIGCSRLAGRKHDQMGVDVLISIKPLVGERNIIVPVQVKSSLRGVFEHHEKYANMAESTIFVIIINNDCADKDIESRMIKALTKVRES